MSNPEYAPLIGRFAAGAVLDCVGAAHDTAFHLTTLRVAEGTLRVSRLALAPGVTAWALVKSVALDSRAVDFARRDRH